MAIDPTGFLTRTHGTWSAPKNLTDSLGDLSCASRRLCLVTTFGGDVLRYNGHGWRKILSRQTEWNGLSCPTGSTFCMLLDGDGRYTVLDDGTLSNPVATGDSVHYFKDLSCASSSFCAAMDGNGRLLVWTHGSWSAPIRHAGGLALATLSCTSRSFCVAVGGARYETYTGTGWTAVHHVPGASNLSAVSCAGPRMCVAVDDNTGSAFVAR